MISMPVFDVAKYGDQIHHHFVIIFDEETRLAGVRGSGRQVLLLSPSLHDY